MIGAYLVNSVTLRKYNGEDVWGTPTARTDEIVKCYIDYKNRNVTGVAGTVVVSMAKVLMEPRTIIRSGFSTRAANTIAYEDVVAFDGKDHVILQIAQAGDFRTRMTEVYAQ